MRNQAKSLGQDVPPSLLARAERVIEWVLFAAVHESASGTKRTWEVISVEKNVSMLATIGSLSFARD
jgi:hypothetical protein